MSSLIHTKMRYEIDEDAAWDYIRHGYLPWNKSFFLGQCRQIPKIEPDPSIDLNTIISDAVWLSRSWSLPLRTTAAPC